ncbi:MAG TPA: four helix bundle protein [Candidatus Edwardsbacteria bacterium]|nr:four helix bundle protein [Candidatus Edwardsbacteria bacterium]
MEETKNQIKSFTDLIVWQKAVELFTMVTEDVENFPDKRVSLSLANQVVRSAGAIGANIAEGHGKGGAGGFRYRLNAARGYACATQDWYHKMARLGYLPEPVAKARLDLLDGIVRMLNSLIAKLYAREKDKDQEKNQDQK